MSAVIPDDLRALAAPFLRAEVLDQADLYAVAPIAPLLGEADPLVCLGLAFAVRAPRHGHVGVDIARVHDTALDGATRARAQASAEPLPWPDPAAWSDAVRASPAVDARADPSVPDATGASPENVIERPFVWWDGLLHTRRYWTYQDRLAAALRARSGPLDPPPTIDVDQLHPALDRLFAQADPAQRLGALLATQRRLAIISGGPGTGKTYTIKRTLALLHHLAPHGKPPRVALAAPTGKAAVRMAEAVREDLGTEFSPQERAWLTGLQPTTLHRLLGFNPRNTTRFRHGPHHPLALDLVVVDEASMVDLPMMTRLLRALPSTARLILLGDRNQLASVEAGSVLADLTAGFGPRLTPAEAERLRALDSPSLPPFDVPGPIGRHAGATEPSPLDDSIITYTKPFRFRQDSGIGHAALAISEGGADRLTRAVGWLTGGPSDKGEPFADLSYYHEPEPALTHAALNALTDLWETAVTRALSWQAGHDPAQVVWACERARVLCAHRRGSRGVDGLNRDISRQLSGRLRRRLDLVPGAPIPVGLPIMITENRYDLGLMNGDVGVMLRGPQGPIVAFDGAQGGRLLAASRLPAHQPVLAMTIHKSQGSQFDHAGLVLPARPTPLLSRELIYTALTRSKLRFSLFGAPRVLRAGLERTVRRSSRLAERIARPSA